MEQIKTEKFIAELRKEKGMTQEQLGERLGVNSRSVSRWENGHGMPDISLLLELADVLGVRLHRLDQVETATSVAAAVIAGIGVGVFKDFSVVDQFVKREKTFVPREEYKPVYDHQKKLFEKGYECLLDYYKMSAEE